MKLTERKKMILIHIAWILALAVILWPLFTIAKYDYPSADDWSFGKYMYRAMQAGEGIAGVFHAIYQTLAQNVWEARFSILILSALQPAAFGEHFYRITPYLMIGSVILSQFLLLRECIAGQAKENRWLILPIGIPMAILQVLYCPYPEESFYWYNGSVNYTFVYSLSLVLLTLYLEIALRETGKAKRVVLTVLACLLADDAVQLADLLGQIHFFHIQGGLAALDAAHVQNIVYDAQQQLAGIFQLVQMFGQLFRLVQLVFHQSSYADDGVHGGADIVAHVGKEVRLSLAGALGRL